VGKGEELEWSTTENPEKQFRGRDRFKAPPGGKEARRSGLEYEGTRSEGASTRPLSSSGEEEGELIIADSRFEGRHFYSFQGQRKENISQICKVEQSDDCEGFGGRKG